MMRRMIVLPTVWPEIRAARGTCRIQCADHRRRYRQADHERLKMFMRAFRPIRRKVRLGSLRKQRQIWKRSGP